MKNSAGIFPSPGIVFPLFDMTKVKMRAKAEKIMKLIGLQGAMISIILCSDEEIRKVNREHRNKDRATDVISFAYREAPFPMPAGAGEMLGDIYIAVETTLRQATEIGHSPEDEFLRLLTHGILHLVGYDHERSTDDERAMQEAEDAILAKL